MRTRVLKQRNVRDKRKRDKHCTITNNVAGAFAYHCCRAKAKSITYSVCAFVALVNAVCKSQAPYYTIFGEKLKINVCIDFLYNSRLIHLILRRTQRDSVTDVNVQHPLSCQIITKLEFSQNIFSKYSNIKLHEHPSSGSRRAVPCGQMDRNDEANSRFSQFELA